MELFKQLMQLHLDRREPTFKTNLGNFAKSISQFTKAELYLEAGLLYQECMHLAWGIDDRLVFDLYRDSILNLDLAVSKYPLNSLESILALHNLNSLISTLFFTKPILNDLKISQIRIKEELSQRLIEYAKANAEETILVNGLLIIYRFDGSIESLASPHKLAGNARCINGERVGYQIPGAFDILLKIPDYRGCMNIIEQNTSLFSTPELNGWCYAVKGWLTPDKSAILFKQAADEFAKHTLEYFEKHVQHKGQWNSISVSFWAPYYYSLHFLCLAEAYPEEAIEHIHKAANVLEKRMHIIDPTVDRYVLLVQAISSCIADPSKFDVTTAIQNYSRTTRITGELENDSNAIDFITNLKTTLQAFQDNPKKQLKQGGLMKLVEGLNNLPAIKESQLKGLEEALDNKAFLLCQGPTNWIYRALENIRDEDILRKVLLRLFQTLSPKFAQNIHGIVEHGRDIIVLKEIKDELVLQLFQVKIGDIDTSAWRGIKQQLEEMMETDIPQILDLDGKSYKKIGYLVFNGHIKIQVEPKVSGWKQTRRDRMNEVHEIMHIDKIVNFIVDNRLVSEFREAIAEYEL